MSLRRHLWIWASASVVGCTPLPGGSQETYQQILGMLCNAPPSIMQNVLTTPQLQAAWVFICGHVQSVPATPVTMTKIAG